MASSCCEDIECGGCEAPEIEVEKLQSILDEYAMVEGLEAQHMSLVTFTAGCEGVYENITATVGSDISPKYQQQISELSARMDMEMPGCQSILNVCPCPGDRIDATRGIEYPSKERTDIDCSSGQHLIICWSGQSPVGDEDLKVFSTHEEVLDNVTCWAICLDGDEDQFMDKAIEKYPSLKHVLVHPDHPGSFVEHFGVIGLPTAFIVQDGVMLWRGAILDLDLPASLQSIFVEGGKVVEAPKEGDEENADLPSLVELDEELWLGIMSNIHDVFSRLPPELEDDITCVAVDTLELKPQQPPVLKRTIEVEGFVPEEFKPQIEGLITIFKSASKGPFEFNLRYRTKPQVPTIPTSCTSCKQDLNQEKGFSCSLDGQNATCLPCSAKANRQDVFFVVMPGSNLDDIIYGNGNLDIHEGTDEAGHIGIACDECGSSSFSGPRFKCAVCREFDMCSTCFYRHLNGEEERHEHVFLCCPKPNQIDL